MKHIEVLFRKSRRAVLSSIAIFALLIGAFPFSVTAAQTASAHERLFADAAQEFGVPKQLLLAISYNESRWQPRGEAASVNGGYGLMNLTAATPVADGRGRGVGKPPVSAAGGTRQYTLDKAAALLRLPPDVLKKDDRQNIRGAAAVLSSYAKELHTGALPTDLAGWYEVTARYSGAVSAEGAQLFADQVYATIRSGAAAPMADGSTLRLDATPNLTPQSTDLRSLALPSQNQKQRNANGAQCPAALTCRFIPAGYAQNSSDPADFGNYDHANRPHDMKIKYIVIHNTEGSYQSAINHFQDTRSYVSCNYIIRSSDGDVTQMVRNEDVSWCAGDWYVNMHSINIEHEGFAAQGDTWYTEEMYQSSAKLVRYLAKKYNIPLDREHIIGHDEVPVVSPDRMAGQHWDPGPYWDWNHYMALLHGVSDEAERAKETASRGSQKTVTILPHFATNQPAITDCSTGSCITLPAQGSNIVYLHTEPNEASPLLSDKYLHPDNAPGTQRIEDWGSRATTGQRYVVAGQQGDWTGVWYGGTIGWFHNPASSPTAYKSKSSTVSPRPGLASIPVYGVAYPEAAAYPAEVPVQAREPLYSMPAGQTYVTTAEKLPTDYFYDATIDYSRPHDHEVIKGQEKYYQITFNKRIAYVKATDVVLKK